MADFDLTEGLRKMFLAGVGAVATGAEKTQEVVEELVKKGELTVEQGKTLNQELTHKVAAFAEKVAAMSAEIDAAAVKVEVEDADEDAADVE